MQLRQLAHRKVGIFDRTGVLWDLAAGRRRREVFQKQHEIPGLRIRSVEVAARHGQGNARRQPLVEPQFTLVDTTRCHRLASRLVQRRRLRDHRAWTHRVEVFVPNRQSRELRGETQAHADDLSFDLLDGSIGDDS